jgi:hypothetical protein
LTAATSGPAERGKLVQTPQDALQALQALLQYQGDRSRYAQAKQWLVDVAQHPDFQEKVLPWIVKRMPGLLGIGGAAAVPAWMMSQNANQEG